MKRRIQLFSVSGLAANIPWFATGADFETHYLGTCDPDDEIVTRSAPYAICFEAERVLSVVYDSREELLEATFVYQHQRESAKTLVSIPYEVLPDVAWDVTPATAAPCLLFSTGRCGSTLLSKLMGALGLPSLSEPDVLTAYLMALPVASEQPGLDHIREVFGFVIAGLLNAAGSRTGVLKFRAQTNYMADQLMASLPQAHGLMLVRDIDPWASSLYRTFSFSPEVIADTLAAAHSAVHACSAIGRPLEIVRYEALCERPVEVLGEIGRRLGLESPRIDEERVRAVMSLDSQRDSSFGQEAKRGIEVPEGFLQEFHHQWASRKAYLEGEGVDFLF
jgi:hypothetical protein